MHEEVRGAGVGRGASTARQGPPSRPGSACPRGGRAASHEGTSPVQDLPLDNLGGTVPHVNLGNKDIHIVVPTHIMEGNLPG